MKDDFFYFRTERETAKWAEILFSKKGEKKKYRTEGELTLSAQPDPFPVMISLRMIGNYRYEWEKKKKNAFGKIKTP